MPLRVFLAIRGSRLRGWAFKCTEIIEEHPVENRVFRMTLAVDPCHGREDDSQNGPDYGRRPCTPDVPGMIESANLSKNVNKR